MATMRHCSREPVGGVGRDCEPDLARGARLWGAHTSELRQGEHARVGPALFAQSSSSSSAVTRSALANRAGWMRALTACAEGAVESA